MGVRSTRRCRGCRSSRRRRTENGIRVYLLPDELSEIAAKTTQRLAQLDKLTVDLGGHKSFDEGHSSTELIVTTAGGRCGGVRS